jgi:hypothetical protein
MTNSHPDAVDALPRRWGVTCYCSDPHWACDTASRRTGRGHAAHRQPCIHMRTDRSVFRISMAPASRDMTAARRAQGPPINGKSLVEASRPTRCGGTPRG